MIMISVIEVRCLTSSAVILIAFDSSSAAVTDLASFFVLMNNPGINGWCGCNQEQHPAEESGCYCRWLSVVLFVMKIYPAEAWGHAGSCRHGSGAVMRNHRRHDQQP